MMIRYVVVVWYISTVIIKCHLCKAESHRAKSSFTIRILTNDKVALKH